jgi:hypothetical protein
MRPATLNFREDHFQGGQISSFWMICYQKGNEQFLGTECFGFLKKSVIRPEPQTGYRDTESAIQKNDREN